MFSKMKGNMLKITKEAHPWSFKPALRSHLKRKQSLYVGVIFLMTKLTWLHEMFETFKLIFPPYPSLQIQMLIFLLIHALCLVAEILVARAAFLSP